jgi:diguanylate cyclase (GGDEF)-like protein
MIHPPCSRPRSTVLTAVSDHLRASPTVALQGSSTPVLEETLRALLRLRSGSEMEKVVLDQVRRLTSAVAAALYRARGSEYELRTGYGPDPARWESLLGRVPGIARGLSGVRSFEAKSALAPGGDGVLAAASLRVDEHEEALLLLGPRGGAGPYRPRELALLERSLDAFAAALANAAAFDHLNSLVLVDPLTGCYNRRGFDEHLKVEMVRARRYRRPISLMVLDVDHFKQVNDGYGHLVGDVVLRRLAEVLASQFRTTDVVCRFGGDEFAVIFPETPREDVMRLAERLRARVAGLYPGEELPRVLTISLGIAAFPEDAGEPEALLHAADRALYRAKAGGRNRVAGA